MAKKSLVGGQVVESNPGAGALMDPNAATQFQVADPLYQRTPYVQFISNKSPNFGLLSVQVRDLQDGDPVLILPEPEKPRKLNPLRFYLLNAFQHFSKVDNTGRIEYSVLNADDAKASPDKLAEHVETVILVVEPDGITPARCTFKTTKVNAAHTALAAVKQAASAEWGGLSADHKATLAIPDPRFRFTTTVNLRRGTGRSSGYAYVAASGAIQPCTAGDARLVAEFSADPAQMKLLNAVIAAWQERKSDVMNRVDG